MSATLQPEPAAGQRPRPAAAVSGRRQMSFGLVFRLALADLWHERMLTACVVIALTAVMAPLLILFSLKYGLVETLRTRLVADPRNREIRPELGHTFTEQEIRELRALPGVQFVVPNTRPISGSVRLSLEEDAAGRQAVEADLAPTGAGDPLLVENGVQPPGDGACVLSYRAWKNLCADGRKPETVRVSAWRSGNGRDLESATTLLRVAGVADQRATEHVMVFTALDFLEKVEAWRDGRAVPQFGWPGGNAQPEGVTDRVVVASPRPWDSVERSSLPVSTPWISEIRELTVEEAAAGGLPAVPLPVHHYELATSSKRHDPGVDERTLTGLRRALPEDVGAIYAQCRPLQLTLTTEAGQSLNGLFQALPFLVGEPGQREAPASPPPAAAVAPAPETPVPKAVPVPDAVPAMPADKSFVPSFPDLRGFQNRLNPPPPTSRPPEPERGRSPAPSGSGKPAAPKRDRLTPNQSTSIWPLKGGPRPVLAATTTAARPAGAEKEAAPPAPAEDVKAMLARRAPKTHAVGPPERLVFLPPSAGLADGTVVTVTFESPFLPITFPAVVRHQASGQPAIPQSLAAVLRLAMDRGVAYDPATEAFHLSRRGYPAARIVAGTVEDVEALAATLAGRGIPSTTAAARIRDVRELDHYTSYVFYLVAAVGLAGAAAALLASLFAAVERKRRALGVLRLLGLRRRTLVRLPLYQSAVIVSLSLGLSLLAWQRVTAAILHMTTASQLLGGERIQTLPDRYLWAAWGGSLAVAALSSLLAGMRVMRVDPSEAIRDE